MNEDTLISSLSNLTDITQKATQHLLDIAERAEDKLVLVEETSRTLGAQLALVETRDVEGAIDALLESFTAPLNETVAAATAKLDAVSFEIKVPAEDLQDSAIFAISDSADTISQFVTDVLGEFDAKFEEAEQMLDTVVEQLVETGEDYQKAVSGTLESFKETMEEGIPSLSQVIGELFDSLMSDKIDDMVDAIIGVLDKLEEVVQKVVKQIFGAVGEVADVLTQINEIIQPLQPAFDAMDAALG